MWRELRSHLRPRPEHDVFAEWAATYDEHDNPLIQVEQPVMAELLGNLSDAVVLDLGCGTGRLMGMAARKGARWTVGVDRCEEMIHRVSGLTVVAEITQLPFAGCSFDCVMAGLTIGYVTDLERFIREAARVLKPDGRLICSDLHPCGERLGWKRTYPQADGRTGVAPSHTHHFSDIHRALRNAGLDLIDVREPILVDRGGTKATCRPVLIWSAQVPK